MKSKAKAAKPNVKAAKPNVKAVETRPALAQPSAQAPEPDLLASTVIVFWGGFDVDKAKFEAAVHHFEPGQEPDLQRIKTQSFPRAIEGVRSFLIWADRQLEPWRQRGLRPVLRVCMESTGSYSMEIAEWLLSERPETQPAIVNPALTKAFGQSLGLRNKNDKVDARMLARYGAERSPRAYEPPDPAYRELKAVMRHRKALVEERDAARLRASEPATTPFIAEVQRQHIESLENLIAQLDERLQQIIQENRDLKCDVALADSAPGVGAVVAATVLAEMGDVRHFKRARQITAMAGVTPREYTSGKTVRKRTRMSKKGNPHVRAVLYMAAMACLRTKRPNPLSNYYHHLMKQNPKRTRMSALGALMRKILVLIRAIIISGVPYDPDYQSKKSCG